MLDFARTLRNLIHNNGTYFGKQGKNESLPFNGQTYNFEHGKGVRFAYQQLLFSIYEQILLLSDDLNDSPLVKALPPTPVPQT